jgi:hypothetical protein
VPDYVILRLRKIFIFKGALRKSSHSGSVIRKVYIRTFDLNWRFHEPESNLCCAKQGAIIMHCGTGLMNVEPCRCRQKPNRCAFAVTPGVVFIVHTMGVLDLNFDPVLEHGF